MRAGLRALGLSVVAVVGSSAGAALAANPYASVPADYESSPAYRFAGYQGEECLAELDRRAVPYTRAADREGVDMPVRLTGPLHGVSFTLANRTPEQAATAPAAVLDCRLALALDELGSFLSERGIREVGYRAAYRAVDGQNVKPGQRHPAGLAMDVLWFGRSDGVRLSVARDFHGQVGAKTCGRNAQRPQPGTERALELRQLLCDLGSRRWFNLVLTPNYDRDHHDHVHLEVRRFVRWFLVQ